MSWSVCELSWTLCVCVLSWKVGEYVSELECVWGFSWRVSV